MHKREKIFRLIICCVIFVLCVGSSVQAKEGFSLKTENIPKKVVAKEGEMVSIECRTNAPPKKVRYRWQKKAPGSKTWKDISGAAKSRIRIKAEYSKHKTRYRCVVTLKGQDHEAVTNACTLLIRTKPVIISQPQDAKTRKTGSVVFSVRAKGKNLAYRWYVSKDKGKTWKKTKHIEKDLKIDVVLAKYKDYRYRCEVRNTRSGKLTRTRAAKMIITDMGVDRRYWYDLDRKQTHGLLRPKVADRHVYVSSYGSKYGKYIKQACERINDVTGTDAFVYTSSLNIADIVVTDWSSGHSIQKTIYTVEDTVEFFTSSKMNDYAGVAFSNDSNGEHFMICLNRSYLDWYLDRQVVMVIIHELGHCIGLGHSKDKNSVMYYICAQQTSLTTADVADYKRQAGAVINIGSGTGNTEGEKMSLCRGTNVRGKKKKR